MKKIWILAVSALLAACKFDTPTLPGSGGKTCEVIVVTPKSHWDGHIGKSIRAFLGNVQPVLNQPEPYFDLVNILPQQFNESEMFKHHRNVVIVEVNPEAKPAFELVQEAWAYPPDSGQIQRSRPKGFRQPVRPQERTPDGRPLY